MTKLGGKVAKFGGALWIDGSITHADAIKWIIGALVVNFAGTLGGITLIWQIARR